MRGLAAAVGKALAEGPVEDIAELRRERAEILAHLEDGNAERIAARDFVPRLRVFTHNEVYGLHTPNEPLPLSLPDYSHEQRQRVSSTMKNHVEEFTKERKEMERDKIIKALIVGDMSHDEYRQIKEEFTIDEAQALRNPKRELPATMPRIDPEVRIMIAETLNALSRERTGGGAGSVASQAASAQIWIDEDYADQALQLACAVTDRVDASSKAHRLPLQAHISQLLKKAAERDDLPEDKVEEIARDIATDRATLESRMRFAKELIAAAPPPTSKWDSEEQFDERIFLSQLRKGVSYDLNGHPLKINNFNIQQDYTDGNDARVRLGPCLGPR